MEENNLRDETMIYLKIGDSWPDTPALIPNTLLKVLPILAIQVEDQCKWTYT